MFDPYVHDEACDCDDCLMQALLHEIQKNESEEIDYNELGVGD